MLLFIDLEEFFVATHDFFYLEPFVTWDRELRLKRNEWRKSNHNMNA